MVTMFCLLSRKCFILLNYPDNFQCSHQVRIIEVWLKCSLSIPWWFCLHWDFAFFALTNMLCFSTGSVHKWNFGWQVWMILDHFTICFLQIWVVLLIGLQYCFKFILTDLNLWLYTCRLGLCYFIKNSKWYSQRGSRMNAQLQIFID